MYHLLFYLQTQTMMRHMDDKNGGLIIKDFQGPQELQVCMFSWSLFYYEQFHSLFHAVLIFKETLARKIK